VVISKYKKKVLVEMLKKVNTGSLPNCRKANLSREILDVLEGIEEAP
jgi:hypothetical protein